VLVLTGATFAITSVLLYMLREEPVAADAPDDDGAALGFGANEHSVMLTFGGTL
jgi:hypothetical protein